MTDDVIVTGSGKHTDERDAPQRAVNNSRWDNERKRDGDRADSQRQLTNSRWDTERKRDGDRIDTQRQLGNTRWDNERKRDGDRADSQRQLVNTRWDTEHKRDGDRSDTAESVQRSRQDTVLAFESSLYGATHGAFITVASNAIDRSLSRAATVTAASSAVATIYTGLLTASYVSGAAPKVQAVIPAIFLGLSVIFAATYTAFLHQKSKDVRFLDAARGEQGAQERLLGFFEWIVAAVYDRAWALRVAILSLGIGLALLPLAFVGASAGWTAFAGGAGGVLLVLWLLGEWLAPEAWPMIASARARRAARRSDGAKARADTALDTLRSLMGPAGTPAEGSGIAAAASLARTAVDRARRAWGRADDAAHRTAAAEDRSGYAPISKFVTEPRELALVYPDRVEHGRGEDDPGHRDVPVVGVVAPDDPGHRDVPVVGVVAAGVRPPAPTGQHVQAAPVDVETLFGPVLEVAAPRPAVGVPFDPDAGPPSSADALVPPPVAPGSPPPESPSSLVGVPFVEGAETPPAPDSLVPPPVPKGSEPPDYPVAPHKPFPVPPFEHADSRPSS